MRAYALAGLLGALLLFAGDMLFYGQWGSGSDAQRLSFAIAAERPTDWIAASGMLSWIAGLGYLGGVLHIRHRAASAGRWSAGLLTVGVTAIVCIAIATHAVWAALALGDGLQPTLAAYLASLFIAGQIVAAPTALLLAVLTVADRTTWPRWMALANPGLLYLALATAWWVPAPIGAALVGGAFNLAFAMFFLLSWLTAPRTP